jgi:hypothetical protein
VDVPPSLKGKLVTDGRLNAFNSLSYYSMPTSDTDGGLNYIVKGSCSACNVRHEDYCINDRTLREYYVSSNACKFVDVNKFDDVNIGCNNGAVCGMSGELCGSGYPSCCPYLGCISAGRYVKKCMIPMNAGCPVLKVWDGNDFKEIEKLNIHSKEGIDTTYSTTFDMKPKDGKYNIKLSEIWYAILEGSHIDSVKLIDSTGKECRLISAKHSNKGDVLSAIEKSDDVRVDTKPGEDIDLLFERCSGEEFTFSIEGYNRANRWIKTSLSYMNIIAFIVTVAAIIIVFVSFKLFARKK